MACWRAKGGIAHKLLICRRGVDSSGVDGRCWNAGDQRCTSSRTTGRASSEGFDSGLVACLSSGFGFLLRRAGFGAFEAVLVVPLVAAVALFGLVLLEGLIFEGVFSMGVFCIC